MFQKTVDERLSAWKNLREKIDSEDDSLSYLIEFWNQVPVVAYNHKIDQYNPKSWPTPWEILVENKYDDFTIALMIGWTLKLTKKFANSNIIIRTMVDETKTRLYNLVYIDENIVLNYSKWKSLTANDIPESFLTENVVNIDRPR